MQITLYTIAGSTICEEVKAFLNEKDVKYRIVDISQDEELAQKLIAKTGHAVVPQIQVDKQYIVGFDRDKLEELIAQG